MKSVCVYVQMRNRTSYVCGNCDSSFSDLEVNQLLDSTGVLRCSFCSSELEEKLDAQTDSQAISMTRYLQMMCCLCAYWDNRFNMLIRPLNSLLRQTENINLAPEVLEPSPQNISILVSYIFTLFVCIYIVSVALKERI